MCGTVLRRFRLSEKGTILSSTVNQYTFEVALEATKMQIARAVYEEFHVRPLRINVLRQKGKVKRYRIANGRSALSRKSQIKKAFVTLRDGDKIETV
ncbi:MAG: 50S ribosomal protein L23 [Puniceicoccales bacterium]|nr:50S ribosomal protein L23 [Puniceicoccales bacterium]